MARILYVSSSILPSTTANSVHVMKMAQALAQSGCSTELIGKMGCGGYTREQLCEYYDVKPVFEITRLRQFGVLRYVVFVPQLFFNILKRRKRVDLVYTRNPYAALFAKILNLPFVYESHAVPHFKFLLWLENGLLASSALKKFIVISNALKKDYRMLRNFSEERFLVASDGADPPALHGAQPLQINDRRNNLKVGYTGHLYKGRGIEILLECAKRLENIEFHIVGGNKTEVDYWRKKAAETRNVRFYGHVKYAEAIRLRNQCDILLMPYQTELHIAGAARNTARWMSPMKLFEYMASGKPIISSDIPVLREVLNERNAILVKCDDVDAWVNAIEKLKDGSLRKELAANAYREFIENYTWTSRVKRILDSLAALNSSKLVSTGGQRG